MIRRPPRSTRVRSSAASDVYKRQVPAPLHVVRQHVQKNVRLHMIPGAVVNGANPQVDPLQAAERTLHLRQSLVAADRVLDRAATLGFAGADYIDTIQSRCASCATRIRLVRNPALNWSRHS